MTWFAFQPAQITGHQYSDINAAGAEEKALVSAGFHGYATQAQADANRNRVSILQIPLLDSLDTGHAVKETVTNPAGAAKNAAKDLLGNGFKLVFGNTSGLLGRILKAGIGIVLLVAGILKLSSSDRKLEQVIPVVGGMAGKVLQA